MSSRAGNFGPLDRPRGVRLAHRPRPNMNRPILLLLTRSLLAVVLLAANAAAQVIQPREPRTLDQWLFSLSAFGAIPLGEFKQYEDGGGGGDVMLGFQPWRRQPLVIRAQGGGMLYGALGAYGYQQVCDDTGYCWTERVRYNARNHTMWFVQGGPELMATDGTWRPFAYALAGWTFFRSWANYKPDTPYGTEWSQSLFHSRNFSTSYGAGLRRVTTKHGREGGFEISARVTRNAKASYLTEAGLDRNPDGSYVISPRYGAANVLFLQVGWWVGPYINWNER